MARQKIRSTQHARRRQDERRRQLRFYAGLVVFFAILLVSITHWRAIQIQNIEVEGGKYVSSDLIVGLTENILSEPVIGVMSRENIILLPRQEIYGKISDISSRIESVDIDVKGLRSVEIKITDRQPAAEVCRQPTGRSLHGCHFVDKTGYIFSKTDGATTTSQIKYVADSGLRRGTQLLPEVQFQDIQSFTRALSDINLDASLVYLEEYGDVMIPVTDAAGSELGSVDLRVNIYDDLSQVLANLQTVLDNDSFVTNTPTNGEPAETISPFSLEYIDLRFENKVFYK